MEWKAQGRRPFGWTAQVAMLAGVAALAPAARGQLYPSGPEITKDGSKLYLEPYATVPKTASGTGQTTAQVARVNFLRSEPVGAPGAASRFFTNDLNGNLYILNKTTRAFSPYIDFKATFGTSGTTFFNADAGFAAGVVTFQFDPEYAMVGSPNYGKFYTTHTEVNTAVDPNEYRQAVLTGWQDTNPNDNAFAGTRREMMRTTYQNNIHPIGDLVFNPNAGPSHADYRNLYISSGDGGAGETSSGRNVPQNLNNLLGKVLRIHPDASGPAPYTVPADNPWASDGNANTFGEIWARGMRNPHRMYWDGPTDKLIVNDIGFQRWEEINVIRRGENYGYSQREGDMALTIPGGSVSQIPANDATNGYTYPAAAYSHHDGDAISSGFVYRGSRVPDLVGKYVFAEITNARVFYCDYADLLAKEADGNPHTQAAIHEFQIVFEGQERELFNIVRDEWDLRNDGLDDDDRLPGNADSTVPLGGGRADIRLALGGDGELYILSKSDGMIRAIVPEPAGTGLLFCGAAVAALRRRRRRRSAR